MKLTSSLWMCAVLAACGGSNPAPKPAAPRPEVSQAFQAGLRDGSVRPMAGLRDPSVRPAKIAVAIMRAVADGAPIGVVTFERGADGMILLSGDFSGLGKHTVRAFYIHQYGNCADRGTKVGGHLDPTRSKHGPPASSQRHAGDFGELTADADGNARLSMRTDSITMEQGGADSVIDRAVVIHINPDSNKGTASAALACGVIQLVDGL